MIIKDKDRTTPIYKQVITDPYALHIIETLEFDNRLLESQLLWQRIEHNHEREIALVILWSIILTIIIMMFLSWMRVIP